MLSTSLVFLPRFLAVVFPITSMTLRFRDPLHSPSLIKFNFLFRTEMKTICCVVFLWILVMLFCSPAFMAHGLTIKVAEHVISFVLKLGSSQANRTSGNCAYLDGQTIPLINVGKWNRVTYQVRKLAGYILPQISYIT